MKVVELREHLRGGSDRSEDGWVVLLRHRSWIGLSRWWSRRRSAGGDDWDDEAVPADPEPLRQMAQARVATTSTRRR
jgi:hypothetical protein